MQLREWLTTTDTSIKAFARAVKVERAMIYRYFLGTIPRARTIRRIEIITKGAVTAQDFYACAMQRMGAPAIEVQPPADQPRVSAPMRPEIFNVGYAPVEENAVAVPAPAA